MAYILLALFIGVPLIEIAVFINIGGLIGIWPTIAIVVLTAVIGTWLLRMQGLNTLARAQQSFQRGEMPVAALFDGLCLLVAGALLLTPGFVTDAVGFLLFMPPFRVLLIGFAWRFLQGRGSVHVRTSGTHPSHRPPRDSEQDDTVIEGEYTEIEKDRDDDREKPDDRR